MLVACWAKITYEAHAMVRRALSCDLLLIKDVD